MGGAAVTDEQDAGPVLLQGGAEMQPACRDMDSALLDLVDDLGIVVVLLGAAGPGDDYARTAARAWDYYEPLVGDRTLHVAPHPEDDLDSCVLAVSAASLLVIPGGSPARLLQGLRAGRGRLADTITRMNEAGVAVSGASAGAMVLCERTVLPEHRGAGSLVVADGLGLVPGLALAHDDGVGDRGWQDPDRPDGLRWGLPEAGGVLLHGGRVRAVGRGQVRVLAGDRRAVVGARPVRLEDLLRF